MRFQRELAQRELAQRELAHFPRIARLPGHFCPLGGLNCGVDCEKRINAVRAVIAQAARPRRAVADPRLLAVSKAHSAAQVRAAYAAGQREFGENYVREALAKIAALADLDIAWHFIGAIQSNKTRDIARHFHWVHTVDRAKIATRLDAAVDRPLDVCVQVNVDAEPQKAGIEPNALPALIAHIAALPRLRLRGLMVIPRQDGDRRLAFRRTRMLFQSVASNAGEHWDTLSMGMSDDFETAIGEGATIVRIGTAIFGPRNALAEAGAA